MKIRIPAFPWPRGLCTAALLALAVSASAADTFPGLKVLLTDAEWRRAGLDRLTPDELGVIDAALIRREVALSVRHQTEVARASEVAAAAPAPKPSPGLLARFGLPVDNQPNWRDLPPLQAKVLKWESANRFRLDNGQVWEGYEPIPYDLVGKDIEIHARPNDQFALVVNGVNTTLRVIRLR